MMGIFLVLYVLEKREENKVRDAADFLSPKKKNKKLRYWQ